MLFGHAPISFPAVLRVPIPFDRVFSTHLMLLRLSLILRVSGDLAGSFVLRRWGGQLNAVALLLFLANTLRAASKGHRSGRQAT